MNAKAQHAILETGPLQPIPGSVLGDVDRSNKKQGKREKAPAPKHVMSENDPQELQMALRNAVDFLNMGVDCLQQIAAILSTVTDDLQEHTTLWYLASAAKYLAEDYGNSLDCCAESLTTEYFKPAEKAAKGH